MLVGGAFSAWALMAMKTTGATWALAPLLAVAAALLAFGWSTMRLASRLPRPTGPRTPAQRAVGRRFGLLVGIEVLAFAILNPVLAVTGHFTLLPSLNLVIVGLHLLPLARLFAVPRYFWMGVLFCIIPVATLLWIPGETRLGAALAWYIVPSLGCGIVSMLTGAAGMREARQSSTLAPAVAR